MSPASRNADLCGICGESQLAQGLYAVKEVDPIVRVPACRACWALRYELGMAGRPAGCAVEVEG